MMSPVDHHKYFSFCLSIGIKIYPQPVVRDGSIVKIIIENNGKQKVCEEKYSNEKVYNKINELLETIYNESNPFKS